MAFEDRYGLPISTASDAAAEAYRRGVDLMLSAWPGTEQAFDAAIAADADFALAHAARARMHLVYADMAQAQARAAKARELVARNGTEREKSHVEILALTTEGQPVKALELALSHLERWPRDATIMALPLGAFGLFAFSGMADHDQARVDLCERYKAHYGDDWWFLTNLGWAHTENKNVVVGRRITQQGFDKRRENANAVHSLLHAMFEDGSLSDADALVKDWLPGYDRSGLLYGHVCWHHALLSLEQGDTRAAAAIYTERLQPKISLAAPLNMMTDGVSLMWRLEAAGMPVQKDLSADLVAYAERWFPRTGNAFAEVHMAMLAALTGNRASLDNRIADLNARHAKGKLPAGSVVPETCRAVRAFADQDYQACATILEPVADDVVRIGGSHAQREMIEDTLLIALMKSGQAAKARRLLDQRLHRRPSVRDTQWLAATTA